MVDPAAVRSWYRAAYRAMAANPSTRYGLYAGPLRLVPMESTTGEPLVADVQRMTERQLLAQLKEIKP